MAPSIKKSTSKKAETGHYAFYKDRLASFKNFAFDKDEVATCTSRTLARAGFYSTGGDAAKCPFCLKELEFEAEDDPWQEHQRRGIDCEFVRQAKLDESEWTVEDALIFSQYVIAMTKYEENSKMLNDWRKKCSVDALTDQLTKLAASTTTTKATSRRIK